MLELETVHTHLTDVKEYTLLLYFVADKTCVLISGKSYSGPEETKPKAV